MRLHVPLMLLTAAALLAALWAGLLRLGWQLPAPPGGLAALHGPLMVSGFLGTLVSLERAVALRRAWCYAAPALAGSGALLLLFGAPLPGALAMTAGSALLVAISAVRVRHERALHALVMGAGALSWLGGNLLWLGQRPLYQVSYWWAGFLVLVIAGERLELGRVLRPSRRTRLLFAAAVGLFGGGLLLSLLNYDVGLRVANLGTLAIALWLGRYDVARRTVRQSGLTRYIAANLLVGYAWLALSGALGLVLGALVAGPLYDAWLHTLFLGFVFGMIFAHAPIILPAVVHVTVPFHPVFYLPPLLLHAGLALRVAGDLAGTPALRQWGGLVNVIAILLFILVLGARVVQQQRALSPVNP